jgi:pyruvate formate lyase activating enzyme
VTAGYIHPEPAREFFAVMDAANVDLKAFTDDFYHKLCVGHLQPVLDTLAYIHHETDCWLEITTLLIPGQNDSPAEINELATWVARELGPDVPLHFTAFHPDWKMADIPPTPRQQRWPWPAVSASTPACTMFTPATCTTAKAAPLSAPIATPH